LLFPNIIRLLATHPEIPQPFYQGKTTEPQVALACNVFWGEEYLPEMLDTMDKYNIKATFFIGGSWAKRNPDMLKLIVQRGHELGNHTYSHPHPSALNKDQNKDQIKRAEELVFDLTGIRTALYAPPYGEFNDTVLIAASELGYRTIMWSIDTIDWKRPPEDVIINRVMKKIHNGAIILIHPTEPTAKALPELISRLQESGYTLTTVSSILE
jgi:probable sporulation protein (polysaccharide deacetylase family)